LDSYCSVMLWNSRLVDLAVRPVRRWWLRRQVRRATGRCGFGPERPVRRMAARPLEAWEPRSGQAWESRTVARLERLPVRVPTPRLAIEPRGAERTN